jgi:hypothetical protein
MHRREAEGKGRAAKGRTEEEKGGKRKEGGEALTKYGAQYSFPLFGA